MGFVFTDAVKAIHGKDTEVLLIHNDLPTNDFASVIQNLYGKYDSW